MIPVIRHVINEPLHFLALVVASLVVSSLVQYLVWVADRRWKYDLHKLPCPKGCHPIIGHASGLTLLQGPKPRMSFVVHDWALQYGKIFRMKVFGKDVVVVHDPKFILENILTPGETDMPKSSSFKSFQKLFSPNNLGSLFTVSKVDARIKAFRKTIAMAFSSDALRKKFPQLVSKGKQLADLISPLACAGTSFNMQDLGVRFAFDSICLFGYNLDFDTVGKGSHPFLDLLGLAANNSRLEQLNPLWGMLIKFAPFLPSVKESKQVFKKLYAEYAKLMELMDWDGKPPEEEDKSIWAQLMRLKNPLEGNRRATREELQAELGEFMLGGTDTVGHQISWILMTLACHPEVQDKIFEELRDHGLASENAREIEFSDMTKLTYLNWAMKEGLRLVPVGPGGSSRISERDMNVLGYKIPKGTRFLSQRGTLNKCPWIWENGEKFDPDRWGVKGEKGDAEGRKLWTFGAGRRSCIGQRLGMLVLQMELAILLSRFKFELDPRMGGWEGSRNRAYDGMVTVCDGGMWMQAQAR